MIKIIVYVIGFLILGLTQYTFWLYLKDDDLKTILNIFNVVLVLTAFLAVVLFIFY